VTDYKCQSSNSIFKSHAKCFQIFRFWKFPPPSRHRMFEYRSMLQTPDMLAKRGSGQKHETSIYNRDT
jgi:hypothetical protein